ncbi:MULTISPECIES: hypothetical protein [Pseudonocardia]|jgi:hypothetical protein|uniref:Uncharacterized protein n=1 Tax=Pseudonocardia alni TaxID=33907 RepID=A0A852W8C5_PSEA5|nr:MULTISPECIES: hypothetical protein [Pseudonocardia]NYG05328.1 hypothetical protein [Pseudonocardia antarctica]PKB41361.1 hypothetical protein ATL51_0023 [Pseudonocardia alni]
MTLRGLPAVEFQQPTNKAVPLFSYPHEQPPAGALDIQVTAAPTLSLLYDRLCGQDSPADLDTFRATIDIATQSTVRETQQLGGYVAHAGRAWPCHLEITPVIHPVVPGIPGSRLHLHLLVGPTAIAVHDGRRYPIDRGSIDDVVDDIYVSFRGAIEYHTTDRFRRIELHWGPPRAAAPFEILSPPLHEELASTDYFIGPCTGLWSSEHEIVLAPDAEYRDFDREIQRKAALQPWAGPAHPEERVYPFG